MDIHITIKPSFKDVGNAISNVNVQSFLRDEINKVAALIERYGKQLSPVKTNRLRGSIHFSPATSFLQAVVKTGTDYACVYGSDTNVVTNKGGKRISSIKIGDLVLTQDGKFHKVLAIPRFLATQKSHLIDLEIFYRKSGIHKLTLTIDHKVLAKINGSICWIQAGDLKAGNIVFQRRKFDLKRGIGNKYNLKKCKNCGNNYLGQGKKYHNLECRNDVYRKNHPQLGSKRREEGRQNIANANRKKLLEHPENHPNRVLAKKGFVTSIEREVSMWLDKSNISYIRNKKIGNSFVDFYCDSIKTIYETDGAYWHQDQNKDIARDKNILNNISNEWKILHLHFTDKRFSKDINENPIPRVFYIQLNPSMNSFIDLEKFEEVKILKVKKWKYERIFQHKSKTLYDLTVEDMHSFVASGIIISNCFVHEGTKFMRARPFMEQGAKFAEKEIEERSVGARLEEKFVDAFKRI